jgi:hypothetical protein
MYRVAWGSFTDKDVCPKRLDASLGAAGIRPELISGDGIAK